MITEQIKEYAARNNMTIKEFGDQAQKTFITVRNYLNDGKHPDSYRKAWFKPMCFYGMHTAEQAIDVLLEECHYDAIHN
jgi:hypothetical protein